jgi:hypothetical protein
MSILVTFFAVLGLAHVVCFFAFVGVTWWAGRGRRHAERRDALTARQIGNWR